MATLAERLTRLPRWLVALVPVALVAVLVAAFLIANPISSLRETPPVEEIAFERVTLDRGRVELEVRNDGPDSVTIAQVLVNDAYWQYQMDDPRLGRLESGSMTIDYPWEDGLPLAITLITSTGVTIEHEIEAAALTPEADAATLWTYALLGLYIGIVPVAIGLLWFPSLRDASARALQFLLALTVGLLLFLLIDTVAEGFELAAAAPAALDGLGIFFIGAIGAAAGLMMLEASLGRRREEAGATETGLSGLALAYLIAAGIGLHNLGEGLAVGAALAAGEAALGTALVLGFALHNTTEGLAIVSPLGGRGSRPSLWHFVAFGVLAGAPAIIGAWLGGFAFSATWSTFAFGLAAGAIAQVVWQIGRTFTGRKAISPVPAGVGLLVGLAVMYVTGLIAA